jgi:hypothetical protein
MVIKLPEMGAVPAVDSPKPMKNNVHYIKRHPEFGGGDGGQSIAIVQVLPAQPGWCAVYSMPDGVKLRSPVALWALVQDEDGMEHLSAYCPGSREMTFMLADDFENFDGFEYAETK